MATASFHPDHASEKCEMCLNVSTCTREIRKLPCLHYCCTNCLQQNHTINHRTVCPICRVDHGKLDINLLEMAYQGSMATSEDPTCDAHECTPESTCFCSQCKQHFFKRHQEAHDGLHDHNMLNLADNRQLEDETIPQLCELHPEHPVILSCERCLQLKCELCEEKDDCANNEGKHSLRSIKRLAETLSPVTREKLDKFSAKREAVEKKLKQVLVASDDINQETRLMLEKIDETVARLKEQIDQEATQLKQRVLVYNSEVSGQAEELTRSMNTFLNEGSDWAMAANQVLRGPSSTLVTLHAELDGRGKRLLAEEFPEFQPTLKRLADRELKVELPLELTDKELKVEFPLKLMSTHFPIPTNLKLTEKVTTPNSCYTVTHHQGRIIHGGWYPLTGLDFNPQLGGTSIRSGCQHNDFLYIRQYENGYNSVHVINLSTQAVRKSVIRYPASGCINHLTVNNNQIIITDRKYKSVKVYSTSDFTHLFDMKSEHLSRWPWGITQLPDGSIVVSDFNNGLVCNLTVERNPTTKWVRKDLVEPAGIAMNSNSQFLLVTSYDGRKIYIMSFSGEVIRELSPPDLQTDLRDISVCGNELVVASGYNHCYQVYEIEYGDSQQ